MKDSLETPKYEHLEKERPRRVRINQLERERLLEPADEERLVGDGTIG
jgi:hypothetical protein